MYVIEQDGRYFLTEEGTYLHESLEDFFYSYKEELSYIFVSNKEGLA